MRADRFRSRGALRRAVARSLRDQGPEVRFWQVPGYFGRALVSGVRRSGEIWSAVVDVMDGMVVEVVR